MTGGVESDAVRVRDRACFVERLAETVAPDGVRPQRPDRQPRGGGRGGEHGQAGRLLPEHGALARRDDDVDSRHAQRLERCLQARGLDRVAGHGDERARRALHDDARLLRVRLDPPDRAGDDGGAGRVREQVGGADPLDVLEAVEEGEEHGTVERRRLDAPEGLVEVVRHHGHQEERHRLIEARDGLRVRHRPLPVVDERQAAGLDRADRPLGADAHGAGPRGDQASDASRPEDGDRGGGHVSAGSTTRLTYCVSE